MRYVTPAISATDPYRAVDVGQCADNEVEVMLTEASDREISAEVFASLVRAVVAHLKNGRYQKLLVTRNLIADVLDLVARSATSSAFHAMSLAETLPERISQEPEDEDQLSAARDALIISLSDVSATSEFAENYPLNSIMVKTLCNWLSLPEPSSQLCVCLMLGNLARSDDVCKGMIHELGLHELLIAILEKSDDLQLLHATLGFLKNLALGDENKGTIAGSGILEPLSKMWSSSSRPQLQYAAIRVVRQLVNGSLSNIQRLLMPLGVAENAAADGDSYIAQLLTLFNKTDDLSIKFEISRIVAAVWRCVRSPASIKYFPDIVELILPRLHCMAAGLAKALEAMVTQSRWPVVKSEGWFALALMARSEGSDAIINLLSDVEFSKAVIEVIGSRGAGTTSPVSAVPGIAISITGADTSEVMPGTEKDMETKDGENALVLVSELLKNSVSTLFFSTYPASLLLHHFLPVSPSACISVCWDVTPIITSPSINSAIRNLKSPLPLKTMPFPPLSSQSPSPISNPPSTSPPPKNPN